MYFLSFSVQRFLLVSCLLSFSLLNHAQNATFSWGGGISGNGTMWCMSTAAAGGHVYTAGYFSGTADFDPGPNTVSFTSAGYYDAFICSLDAAGNYAWVIQLGGAGNDGLNDMETDAQGNIYISGSCTADVDFDPGPGIAKLSGDGSFVAKYDADGNYIWATRATGGIALAVDKNENVYLTGHYQQPIVSDPPIYANNTYICKLNSAGVFQWRRSVGGKREDIAWSIAVDGEGNVIAGGSFMSDTIDIDPGPNVFNVYRQGGGFDIFLIKLTAAGDFIWGGAMTAEYPYDIKTDAGNNIYITGLFARTADFDPGPGTYNLTADPSIQDVFICKLSANGQLTWAKQLAGSTSRTASFAKAMAIDNSGNIYTTGYIQGTFDMDPGPNTAMVTSVAAGGPFVSKLDADGNYIWGKAFGGTTQAQAYGIGVDAAQNVYTSGYFKDTIDLDPGANSSIVTTAAGAQGVFINKLIPFVDAPLPLTWLQVQGRLNDQQQATISWKTEETNVRDYTIEKSTDGKTFGSIGTLTAKGNGTHSYMFVEESPLQQDAWYRIKQTDIDAQDSYSTIVSIGASTTQSTATVYPLPARNHVTLRITGNQLLHTKALLVNMKGQILKAIIISNYQTPLSLENLPAGLYVLQLANGSNVKILRQE